MRALRNRSFFVGYGPAIIIYPVVGDMYMRMLLVEMSGYKELCVPYAHPSHVFQSYFCHNPAGQPASSSLENPSAMCPTGLDTFGFMPAVLRKPLLLC